MRYAYITLLSSDNYLTAVLALNRSLQIVKSSYPFVVALSENMYRPEILDILKQEGIGHECVPSLQYSDFTQEKNKGKSVLNTAPKIGIFNLKHYDKLCYIDADTYVLKNIDELFAYPDGAMLLDNEDEDKGYIQGHSALFLCSPKYHNYEFYLLLMKYGDCFDGDLLGKSWFQVKSNPQYRIPSSYMSHYHGVTEKNTKILHFINKDKPWLTLVSYDDNNYYNYLQILNDLYKQYPSLKYFNQEKGAE